MVGEGPPGEAVRVFRQGLLEEGDTLGLADAEPAPLPPDPIGIRTLDANHPVRITYVHHSFPNCEVNPYLSTGDSFTIGVGYHAAESIDDVVFSLELRDDDGSMFMRTDTSILGQKFDLPTGPGLVNFSIDSVPLLDGAFTYSIGVQSRGGVLFDWREPAGRCAVMNPGKTTGFIALPVHAHLLPPEPDAIAAMAPDELVHLNQQA
jgi:hypothetical protein